MYRPLPLQPTQGSIITPVYFSALEDDLPAVVLTPTCDVDQNKWSYLTCVALHAFPGEIGKQILRGQWSDIAYDVKDGVRTERTSLTRKQKERLSDKVEELVKNKIPRFHWFDPWEEGGQAYIADFQLVTSMTRAELTTATHVAYLAPEHLESLPSRYVNYMGRIGTQDRPQGSHLVYAEQLIGKEYPESHPLEQNILGTRVS